jgi:RNA polymerase sigma-70 factor (ECF subfamily)
MVAPVLQFRDEMQLAMTDLNRAKSLVERAQRGDRAAFDELAASCAKPLLARIQRRLGRSLRESFDPEDVLQETLFRAFCSIGKFCWQGEMSFESWLHGIAMKILLHAAREQGRRGMLRISQEPPASGPSPSRLHRREERFARLEGALARLSPEYRQVIRLARFKGLSITEIAEQMGRTPSSVRNLLFRAMQELRESFGDTESMGLPGRSIDEGSSDDAT